MKPVIKKSSNETMNNDERKKQADRNNYLTKANSDCSQSI